VYILRNQKGTGLVPCSAIAAKKYLVIRVLIREFFKEDVHTRRIAVWHYEKAGISSQWFHGTVCITVFPDMVARDRRANPFHAPTVFRLVDTSETGFILKHQMDFFPCGKL
jgi:hypothetical protein